MSNATAAPSAPAASPAAAQAPVTAPCPASVSALFRSGAIDAVCFDVDSTICTTEGIDEFAAFLGCGDAVAQVTRKAMEGSMDFRTALSERLAAMKITKDSLNSFPPVLTPGALSLVTALRNTLDVRVFLVSGGFRPLIAPAAIALGLNPETEVVANAFVFDDNAATTGADDSSVYATFDLTEPTSSSGGKARAVQSLMDTHGLRTVLMVGDGATDLEARPPAAAVVGFGGIAARPAVITGADWFVYSLGELEDMAVASYAAGRAERQQKQQQQEEGKVGTAQTEAETAAVATE